MIGTIPKLFFFKQKLAMKKTKIFNLILLLISISFSACIKQDAKKAIPKTSAIFSTVEDVGKHYDVSFTAVKNGKKIIGVNKPIANVASFSVTNDSIRVIPVKIEITEPSRIEESNNPAVFSKPDILNYDFKGGSSIGVEWRSGGSVFAVAGTGGCVVQNEKGEKFVLTNSHVVQHVAHWKEVTAPSMSDGGKIGVNTLGDVQLISRYHDVALIRISDNVVPTNFIEGLGEIGGYGALPDDPNTIFYKVGRTTGKTKLKISEYRESNIMHPSIAGLLMPNQFLFETGTKGVRASNKGDSGSIIVYFDSRINKFIIVGHLWGGIEIDGKHYTIADPILGIMKDEKLFLLNEKLPVINDPCDGMVSSGGNSRGVLKVDKVIAKQLIVN